MPERILPVLAGGGQTIDRPADPAAGREPLLLMEEAARRAAEDAGGGARLLGALDTLAVVNVICHGYGDAAGLLAERLGCRPARAINTTLGGNTPPSLVNHLCDEIAAGRVQLALVAGAEAWHTARAGARAWRPPAPSARCPLRSGATRAPGSASTRRGTASDSRSSPTRWPRTPSAPRAGSRWRRTGGNWPSSPPTRPRSRPRTPTPGSATRRTPPRSPRSRRRTAWWAFPTRSS